MRVLALAGVLLALAAPASACLVTPTMNILVESNQRCTRFEAEGCMPLPADGASQSFEGTLDWRWDMPACGDSAIPDETVTITFESLPQNPPWLLVTVDPPEIQVDASDYQLANLVPDAQAGTMRFVFTFPITITWTHQGMPDEAGLEGLRDAGMQAAGLVRARSHEQGDFRPSTAVEQFLFDARSLEPVEADGSESSPGAAPLTLVLLAGGAALARRRSR